MIEFINLHKSYVSKTGRNVDALKGVSFSLPETGLVFIVGKSGSGKSTLLNMLGLLDSYDSGELKVNGKSTKDFSANERDAYRALNIGFVFQEFHIIEKYTIGQNLSLALEIGQQEAAAAQIAAALDKVGLAGFENRYARGVSGGQKQRVAIARALIKNPKIILADEPTGNLDSVTSKEIFNLLQQLSKTNLVIVISHDLDSAHTYADRIIELSDGKISAAYHGDGTNETVKLSVDKVNKKELDKLLNAGKKVVLVKNTKPKPAALRPAAAAPINLDTKVKLPFKSSFKLSLMSMRAKWVRVLFTICLSMFAIAFFGFADMVAQFNVNNVMQQEIERSGLPFVPLAMMETKEEGFVPSQERRIIEPEHLDEFKKLNLPHAVKYQLPFNGANPNHVFQPTLIPYYNFLGTVVQGVVETDSPEALGLTLSAGRWPANFNEVVITNFMFERYLRYGIELIIDGTTSIERLYGVVTPAGTPGSVTKLTEFSQIYERAIWEGYDRGGTSWAEHQFPNSNDDHTRWRTMRIVGMIDFDLSPYALLMPTVRQTTPATSEQKAVWPQAANAWSTYLNNYYALPGYYHNLMRHSSKLYLQTGIELSLTLPGQSSTTGQTVTHAPNHTAMDSFFRSDGLYPYWYTNTIPINGFTEADLAPYNPNEPGYNKKQVVVDVRLLLDLLPSELQALYTVDSSNINTVDFAAIMDELGISSGGAYINFKVDRNIGGVNLQAELSGYEIVAVYLDLGPCFYATQNFYDRLIIYPIGNILVPADTYQERMQLLNTLNSSGKFTTPSQEQDAPDRIFSFVIWSSSAQEIYFLNNMFSLFVGVFSLSAIVFTLFSVLLTYSFIAASINARKKDIGILRSLGARQKDIAGIFITEGAFIALIMIILASVSCYLGYFFLNEFFVSQLGQIAEMYSIVAFSVRQVLLMAAVTVAGVAISITLPILRIARKQPVEVIRAEAQ
ncbi:MAG: ABC transporter ATP-binding protein/permease [Firmicutes bacterium]|nr:ABC transporter ATP-binding protein/permease [Bacillota bacterium]